MKVVVFKVKTTHIYIFKKVIRVALYKEARRFFLASLFMMDKSTIHF